MSSGGRHIEHAVQTVDAAAAAADAGVAVLAVRDDALTTLTEADGDYTQLRVTSTGELHTSDATAAGYLATISTNSTTLSGAVYGEDAAHSNEDPGIQVLAVQNTTPAALAGTNGDYAPLQVDGATGALFVNGAEEIGTAAPARAMLAGVEASVGGTPKASKSDGNMVSVMADGEGRVMTTAAPRGQIVTNAKTLSTTAETTILSAESGIYLDLAMVLVSNQSASQATLVLIRDSTSGSVRLSFSVPFGDCRSVDMSHCPHPQAAVNNNWTIECDPAVDLSTTMMAIRRA